MRMTLSVVALAAVSGVAAANPLNPYEFTSLGTVSLTAAGTYTINTDTLQMTGPSILPISGTLLSSGGRGVAVFAFTELKVGSGCPIVVVGSRPGAILSRTTFTCDSTITAAGGAGQAGGSNSGSVPGARGAGGAGAGGGGAGGAGGEGAFGNTSLDSGVPGSAGAGLGAGSGGVAGTTIKGGGGGGGSFATDGGSNAGTSYGSFFSRLEAGSGGGGGGGSRTGNSTNGGTGGSGGGAGGGAIEIGAIDSVTLSQVVDCSGGNGAPGTTGFGAGGGGGGSGGMILVHANQVVAPNLRAPGGTGGTGGTGGPGGNGGTGGNGGNGRIGVQSATSATLGTLTGSFLTTAVIADVGDVDFGDVEVGTSKTLAVFVRNIGGADGCINGQFPQATAPMVRLGNGVLSGATNTVAVAGRYRFVPTTVGEFSQEISILTNAGTRVVTLRGRGVAPTCVADLNNDGFVDDADFSFFIQDYNRLICE